jgi:hypothetical protein
MTHTELEQQAIREAAYYKWERAGRPRGNGVKYWVEAERKLLANHGTEPSAFDIVQEASKNHFRRRCAAVDAMRKRRDACLD